LRLVRTVLVRAPHVGLLRLGRFDERIAAHLDGVAVSGAFGMTLAQRTLERAGKGEVFMVTVRALEDADTRRLDALLAISETESGCRAGLLSAFGWVSPGILQGLAQRLLTSPSAWRREVGLTACLMHGVDPGPALKAALSVPDAGLRGRALRTAGRIARVDLLGHCLAALVDDDARCRYEAACAALLLGDRGESVSAMAAMVISGGPFSLAALRLVLKTVPVRHAQAMLAQLSKEPSRLRTLICGIGMAGDPQLVPWLIAQMEDLKLMRLAGESFSFITGLDLAYLDLERKPPEGVDFGPNDDPADENVEMDQDDGLPWPDAAKIAAWWQANGVRFSLGARYFMGELPSPGHCVRVLSTGYQRQRIAAAQYLSLLTPGTPLFDTRAPALRQRRLLARMTVGAVA